jgi:hypothetical protein
VSCEKIRGDNCHEDTRQIQFDILKSDAGVAPCIHTAGPGGRRLRRRQNRFTDGSAQNDGRPEARCGAERRIGRGDIVRPRVLLRGEDAYRSVCT